MSAGCHIFVFANPEKYKVGDVMVQNDTVVGVVTQVLAKGRQTGVTVLTSGSIPLIDLHKKHYRTLGSNTNVGKTVGWNAADNVYITGADVGSKVKTTIGSTNLTIGYILADVLHVAFTSKEPADRKFVETFK